MRINLSESDNGRRSSINIPDAAYKSVSRFILSVLRRKGQISFFYLLDKALQDKKLKYEGDLPWCLLHVKRDLEAKGIIKVTLGIGPSRDQTIQLVK